MRPATLGLVAGCALAACVLPGRAEGPAFVDDAGRSVSVTVTPKRVMPAGPPADMLLFALAPDLMVGLVTPWNDAQRAVLAEPERDLAIVPRLTPEPLNSDLAAVRALKVDLVVDYGDVAPKYVAVADRVSATTGVPAVLLDGRLAATPAALRRLGALLERRAVAEDLARLAEATLTRLEPLATLPDDARVPVYLARGADGLDAVAAGTTLDEAIRFAGGRNVVARTGSPFRDLTPEAVAALAPRVVIVEDARAVAPDAPLRRALPATTAILVDEHDGFHWVENPPSVNRLIGAVWLAGRLHPGTEGLDDAAARDLARRFLRLRGS